jgi:hypothetical protein
MPLTGSHKARGDMDAFGAMEMVRAEDCGMGSGGVRDAGSMWTMQPSLSSTAMRAVPVMFNS